MNLSTLLSSLCSRVPGEDLTDKQILSIKSDLGSARQAAQNMALGVAAVGNLLANVGAEGEVGQETSERLGWFLEEIGGLSSCWLSSSRSARIASTDRRRLSNEGHSGYQIPGD